VESRWYRQDGPIDLACGECNGVFTPKEEFTIFHWRCMVPYVELLDALRKLAATDAEVKKLMDDLDGKLKKLAELAEARRRAEAGQ
jgi:hypothetical protein